MPQSPNEYATDSFVTLPELSFQPGVSEKLNAEARRIINNYNSSVVGEGVVGTFNEDAAVFKRPKASHLSKKDELFDASMVSKVYYYDTMLTLDERRKFSWW